MLNLARGAHAKWQTQDGASDVPRGLNSDRITMSRLRAFGTNP